MRIILMCTLLFYTMGLKAQSETFEDLSFYADIMVNAEGERHRDRAAVKFNELFLETINQESSFGVPFQEIPYIKTLVSPDTSFRIITYQYDDESGKTKDFGFIQTSDSKVYPLNSIESADTEYEILDDGSWISGLIYHMIPFESGTKKYYVLFIYSQVTAFEKRKTMDILHFVDGSPVLGAELFVEEQEGSRDVKKTREIYHYSADVAMSIRDDKDYNAIVVDHLMEVKSRIPGHSGTVLVPDGTYTAYRLSEGAWIYKDRLFEEKDVSPIEEKISQPKTKDIFGRPKN